MIAIFPEIKVMYVRSEKGIIGSKEAFDMLESKLTSLRGRKFYGLVFGTPPTEKYWACVAIDRDDETKAAGFEIYVIPAGKYAQEKINNWSQNLNQIGETFKRLSKEYEVDPSKPSVEFYRSTKDMLVRLPIKS